MEHLLQRCQSTVTIMEEAVTQAWPLCDETLMAYADGEVPPDEQSRIRRLLENDPEALARVKLFRETTSLLRAAFDLPLETLTDKPVVEHPDFTHPTATMGSSRNWRCQRSRLLSRKSALELQSAAFSRHPRLLDAPVARVSRRNGGFYVPPPLHRGVAIRRDDRPAHGPVRPSARQPLGQGRDAAPGHRTGATSHDCLRSIVTS